MAHAQRTATTTARTQSQLIGELARLLTEHDIEELKSRDFQERVAHILNQLAAAPSVTHQEVDSNPTHPLVTKLRAARKVIRPALDLLFAMLHIGQLLQPGEQWTIGFSTDCGFAGRLIFQTDAFGDCEDERDDEPTGEPARPGEIIH